MDAPRLKRARNDAATGWRERRLDFAGGPLSRLVVRRARFCRRAGLRAARAPGGVDRPGREPLALGLEGLASRVGAASGAAVASAGWATMER